MHVQRSEEQGEGGLHGGAVRVPERADLPNTHGGESHAACAAGPRVPAHTVHGRADGLRGWTVPAPGALCAIYA